MSALSVWPSACCRSAHHFCDCALLLAPHHEPLPVMHVGGERLTNIPKRPCHWPGDIVLLELQKGHLVVERLNNAPVASEPIQGARPGNICS